MDSPLGSYKCSCQPVLQRPAAVFGAAGRPRSHSRASVSAAVRRGGAQAAAVASTAGRAAAASAGGDDELVAARVSEFDQPEIGQEGNGIADMRRQFGQNPGLIGREIKSFS